MSKPLTITATLVINKRQGVEVRPGMTARTCRGLPAIAVILDKEPEGLEERRQADIIAECLSMSHGMVFFKGGNVGHHYTVYQDAFAIEQEYVEWLEELKTRE